MTHNHDESPPTPVERVATRIVAFAWLVLMIVALAVGCEPGWAGAEEPKPRERIERQVERTETVTLAGIDAEIADAERSIRHYEAKIAEARKRLFRLKAERASLDAALPSPTPSPTPRPSPTPKGGR